MDGQLVDELERMLTHAWCHGVRRDYIQNRLWNGEAAIYVSLGMYLRQWLDNYPNIRLWFDVTRDYPESKKSTKKKRIDLVIAELKPDYGDKPYLSSNEITSSLLLVSEIKFDTPSALDEDLEFFGHSMKRNRDTVHVLGWIPTTTWQLTTTDKIEEKIIELIKMTGETPLRFMAGRPVAPYEWSYNAGGKEVYSNG